MADGGEGGSREEVPVARFIAAVRARLEWKKLLLEAITVLDEYESKLQAS